MRHVTWLLKRAGVAYAAIVMSIVGINISTEPSVAKKATERPLASPEKARPEASAPEAREAG